MATKKAAAKKSLASATARAAVEFTPTDKKKLDDAARLIASAVKRAVASQPSVSKIKNPIIFGIWLNPKTKEVEIINQFEL
jgi:hypothetical protein